MCMVVVFNGKTTLQYSNYVNEYVMFIILILIKTLYIEYMYSN
jgi:hypothetical protein